MRKVLGFFRSFQFKLIFIYVMLLLIALQIIGVIFMDQLEDQFVNNHQEALADQMNLLEYNVGQVLMEDRDDEDSNEISEDLNDLFLRYEVNSNINIQVVDTQQNILANNQSSSQGVGQVNTEIIVSQALLDNENDEIMLDQETGERMRVMAQPVRDEEADEVIGAVYMEASMEEIYDEIGEINNILMTSAAAALIITAFIGILLSRTITRPVMDMQKQAAVMGKGDFSRRVRVYGNDEIGELASAFNTLSMNLKEANARTEGERRKLSSVLSHMTDGVIATNELGQVILLNRQAELLLSMSSEEAMGQSLPAILQLSDHLAPSDLYDLSESMILDFSDEQGDYLLEASFSVIRNDDGPVTGLITVLHDVTEQEKMDRERREFVSNVSHELRTPLTTLKSYMEALEDGAIVDQDLAPRFLKVTQNETDRMIRLVNDLLQLSKMDRQDLYIQTKDTDVTQWMNEVVDRFDMVVKDKNITFTRDFSEIPIHAVMDRDKMTQVVDNIISNAIKYSPEGGTVTVGSHIENGGAQIYIQDEGMGIPLKNQHKIFERFYRVDKARARNLGGTGLGLAIAKEIVVAHGGTINVSSEYHQGTRITIFLPSHFNPEAGDQSG
nr:cell wall metabolism sensor histidine kinase WalK [Geomicrobium halophilum]